MPGGMDYQGFNVAMHELGHCVEQTLSLQKVDSYLLAGVPNTAITEAFAFIFQNRDLEILGLKGEARNARHAEGAGHAVDDLRDRRRGPGGHEGLGLALQEPRGQPRTSLRRAVMACAREVWNKYYAPIFGVRDQVILAAYSHLIDAALYLPDYPLGHLIAFQLESYLNGKNLGREMERMCQAGRIDPAAVDEERRGRGDLGRAAARRRPPKR